mgnify:CR=1 FL=1
MRKSVLLSFFVIGLAILSAVTIDIVLFQVDRNGSDSDQVPAFDPLNELLLTEIGKKIHHIRQEVTSDPASAQQQLEKLLGQVERDFTAIEQVSILDIQKRLARKAKDQEQEKSIASEQKLLAEENQFQWLLADLLLSESIKDAMHGRIKEGGVLVAEAIQLAEESHALYLLPKAYNVAGFISNSSNELMEAQHYFSRGIQVAEEIGDMHYSGTIHNNLGLLYLHIERWEKALEYIQRAREISDENGVVSPGLFHTIYLNEAFIHNRLGNVEASNKAYSKAVEYFEQLDASVRETLIHLKGRTEILILNEHYAQAETSANECLDLPEGNTYPLEYGQCYLLLGKAYSGLKDFESALNAIDLGITTFESIEHERWITRAYEQKAEVYDSLGDPQSALAMYRAYYKQDKQQLMGKVYNLEHAFATRRIEQERDLLNVQNRLNEVKLAKERLRFQVASIWGIVAIIALVFTMRRSFSVQNKNKELESLSYVDSLTGLNNRRFYYQQLKDKQRLSSTQTYRIALLDLDYFKHVNDEYGHDVGDEVLIETAKRVKNLFDNNELLIRWGGEEFLALLKNDPSIQQRLSDILHVVNGTTYTTAAGELKITTSIGLSDAGSIAELESSDSYFRNADKKLYEAKRTGRNRYVI